MRSSERFVWLTGDCRLAKWHTLLGEMRTAVPLSVSDNFVWQAAFKHSISSIAPRVQIVCNSFKSSPARDIRLELSTNDKILNKGTLEQSNYYLISLSH